MKNIKWTKGSAVSLDIQRFTQIIEQLAKERKEDTDYHLYQLIEKMHNAIEYSISSTGGEIVHYTGDGALIFFEDYYGMTSAEQAIRFGLDFSCIWRKWKNCFEYLADINFRICIDYGSVVMREVGGLWSGLVLNKVCKIKHKKDECLKNRVVVTEAVMDALPQKSFYKKIFILADGYYITGSRGISDTLSINQGINILSGKTNTREMLDWAVCIAGIDRDSCRLERVLKSIYYQSCIPKTVLIVGEKTSIDSLLSKYKYPFKVKVIDEGLLKNTNRASIRNYLQHYVLGMDEEYEVICFLDGDTIPKPSVFEITNNIIKTNTECLISVPRIEFDYPLNHVDIKRFTDEFLESTDTDYSQYTRMRSPYYFESKSGDKESNKYIGERPKFLASYMLFVPVQLIRMIGDWDENFTGWGEEDIDYTFRAYKKGFSLMMPSLDNYISLHLSHEIGETESLLKNAEYLLSKYPELREERSAFYKAIGI